MNDAAFVAQLAGGGHEMRNRAERCEGGGRHWRALAGLAGLAVILCEAEWLMAAEPPRSSQLADSAVRAAVHEAIDQHGALAFDAIDVEVSKGVVTLSGKVDSALARDEALAAAAQTRGVRSVLDRLSVSPDPATDQEIYQRVLAALTDDPAADAYELIMNVADGVVTLRGKVESYAESQLAARVVKKVRGVRGVVNRILVDWGAHRSDDEIAADIRGLLAADAMVASGLVDVSVKDGHVTLSGAVGSAAEREHAVEGAYVNGVKSVKADGLEVRWWARDAMARGERKQGPRAAADLARSIESAWNREPYLKLHKASASVSQGVAILTGVVDSLAGKRAAERLAHRTVGVRRVQNHLKVRPQPPVSDKQIETRVRSALLSDPFVDRYQIVVSARGGSVLLSGAVDSPFEKSHAEVVAAGIKGVVAVRNLLHFSQPTIRLSDLDMRQEILDELFWSPFVDVDEVKVTVRHGVATLRGTVDSWAERLAAEENAREAGAGSVNNDLRVRGTRDWPL